MLYLSQVLGRPIRDLEGERVATVKDVIVRLGAYDHPPVTGIVARYRRRDFFMSRWRMNDLNQQGVRLNSDILDLRPFVRREGEVLLARDVLDKQLIDVDGKRVVRVNDVQIIEAAGGIIENIVKCTVHLSDINDFEKYNAAYASFFPGIKPARTTVQSVLFDGIKVEIDAIAKIERSA